MKYSWFGFTFMTAVLSASAQAAVCRVDTANQVMLDSKRVQVTNSSGQKASISPGGVLTVAGRPVTLTTEQKTAINQYRQQLNDYIPKVNALATDGRQVANQLVGKLEQDFAQPGSFASSRTTMNGFLDTVEARYHQNEQWSIPPQAFSQFEQQWQSEFKSMQMTLNQQLFSDGLAAMSNGQQGVNLSQLSQKMAALKKTLTVDFQQQSTQIDQQAQTLCDQLLRSQQNETALVKMVPAWKPYRVFQP
ncbi:MULTISPECIES: DUF2884 family protein [unclassified Vibrio]|uniref:DUF2884 family protein n=1 Tax=Vibrio sp. HB236076 TaxID=3232307 RepID=A0AB39HC31_9VIBR|nr:DUF2884 family protein [Vibrio sp. HB161653]MDP5254877.1 DUF2884 family protein [Vibrio sp. HB161653]